MAGGAPTDEQTAARAALGAELDKLVVATPAIAGPGVDLSAAEAQIKDVDIASATAQLAQQQVLQQAGASVLAQPNQAPQLALKLLG